MLPLKRKAGASSPRSIRSYLHRQVYPRIKKSQGKFGTPRSHLRSTTKMRDGSPGTQGLEPPQYFGTEGSTSSDQARMPPFRLRILRKPAFRKKSTASAERLPLRQCATISRDESSSWTRRVSSPSGRRCPFRLQI